MGPKHGISTPQIVAMGASAGGIDAISRLLGDLPATLAAAVLVVLHRPAEGVSHLAEILARHTKLVVKVAQEGDPLNQGVCLIGMPDRHLLVGPDLRIHSWPDGFYRTHNIDLLFNSLACCAGDHTVGVILSGLLKDGVAGLRAIKEAGGMALVQSPDDAEYAELPENAIKYVGRVDLIDTAAGLARAIQRIIESKSSKTIEATF
ncbi:chemotaxis protein CheB [Inquilinus sp.]|uniref:chemotaxis protein CheB n=1 Tax=Inquilinus sp. TaxID=1932117 RepID=UPI0031D7413C